MKRYVWMVICAGLILGLAGPASAHFGMLIPSDAMVMADEARTVALALSFSHPFERVGMDLVMADCRASLKAFTHVLASSRLVTAKYCVLPKVETVKIESQPGGR